MAEVHVVPLPAGASSDDREPYTPPAIVWEEKLEARPNLMAACSQKPLGGGDCDYSPYS